MNALEVRAIATKLSKARGQWVETDVPGRSVLTFRDGDLQIAYRQPWPAKGVEHHAVDIFVEARHVFSARWKDVENAAEIDVYHPDEWQGRLSEIAGGLRIRSVD